jgi:hypothetical protein
MEKKLLFLFLALLMSSVCDNFDDYAVKFEKGYTSSSERDYRKQLYLSNVAYFNQKNSENRGYTLGVNQFTDRTP